MSHFKCELQFLVFNLRSNRYVFHFVSASKSPSERQRCLNAESPSGAKQSHFVKAAGESVTHMLSFGFQLLIFITKAHESGGHILI